MSTATQPRFALVTGGARRVGAGIVRRLCASGFEVVFTFNRSADEANALASDTGATPIRIDFSERDSARRVVSRLKTTRLDLLVNNASVYDVNDRLSAEVAMTVNFDGPMELTNLLTSHLQTANGCVVNLLDIMVERPVARYASYIASKASLWQATIDMALKLAPRVRVNGIAPGVVDWPDDMSPAQRDQYLSRVPLRRAGTPDDVASLVEFLAVRGTYITGQVIRLDGGRSIAP
jgi:pteridine reductase